ncbi:MAG: helix-turn-helix domain-containing protein [Caldilineae bacterium]|nr:MAG: helix-turn-helix domain-containing protein [Caldilineae bacterium]
MPRVFDVIEYPNEMKDRLVQRFPEDGPGHFKIGSQVIVRTGQAAVFFRDGKALDTFGPGRHTITTANIPLLTNLLGRAAFGGDNPFTAEVYFVSTREMTSVGWGTRQPIALQTPGQGLGWLLLGAHGTFGVQVTDPQTFVGRFVGAQGAFDMRRIKERLVNAIVQSATDWFAEVNPGSLMKAQSLLDEMAAAIEVKAQDQFGALGLVLKNITIGGLSPLETSAEKLKTMGLLDAQMYMQLKALETLEKSSQGGGGGMAGAGMGLGAGMGMGATMSQMMAGIMGGQQQQGQGQQQAQEAPAAVPEIMTLVEAAEYLKVAVEDVMAMIESGDLKAKKIGSQYRISKKAIDEYLMS